jgi:hypothetical protein
MSRGGHNWKGSGTVEGTTSIGVMMLGASRISLFAEDRRLAVDVSG